MDEYEALEKMRVAIEGKLKCAARHAGAVMVDEMMELPSSVPRWLRWASAPDRLGIKSEVQIFELTGHPSATKCYSWGYDPARDGIFAIVLEQAQVKSAQAAVRAKMREIVETGELKRMMAGAERRVTGAGK